MRKEEFSNYLANKKRNHNGKIGFYSENSIKSRISCLQRLERHFNVDIENKVKDYETACQFLRDIRDAEIESLEHTPLSNAFRHYYEFSTGKVIERIF